jgi:hypothetical protein
MTEVEKILNYLRTEYIDNKIDVIDADFPGMSTLTIDDKAIYTFNMERIERDLKPMADNPLFFKAYADDIFVPQINANLSEKIQQVVINVPNPPRKIWIKDIQKLTAQPLSNAEIARRLGISNRIWKRYATGIKRWDYEDSKLVTLWDVQLKKYRAYRNQLWKNGLQAEVMSKRKYKTNPKVKEKKLTKPNLIKRLENITELCKAKPHKINQYNRIVHRILLKDPKIKVECSICGFGEKRITDGKTPLLLEHSDNDKTNFNLDNLRYICLNCSFLYNADSTIRNMVPRIHNKLAEMKRFRTLNAGIDPALGDIATDIDGDDNDIWLPKEDVIMIIRNELQMAKKSLLDRAHLSNLDKLSEKNMEWID